MPFGRRSPLEALALPGAILAYKYSQFRQRRREAASRRVTERELSALHHKIDKLLNKLEESEPEPPTSQEDECVICINARATMQTSPCGHRVVCRRCFVKTIQSAVAQRLLPLRCVICRARITRLTSSSGTWRLQESASSYSMGTAKSWTGLGTSPSSYSMGGAGALLGAVGGVASGASGGTGGGRVAQSTSLYSMSSGSSFVSGHSNLSHCSNGSSVSTDASLMSSTTAASSTSTIRSAASEPATHRLHHQQHHHQPSSGGGCCSDGCNGAYPRNAHHLQYGHHKRSKSCRGGMEMHSRLPPIKEFRSPTKVVPSPTNDSKNRFAAYEAETSLSICVVASTSTRSLGMVSPKTARPVAAILPHGQRNIAAAHSATVGHRPRSRPSLAQSGLGSGCTSAGSLLTVPTPSTGGHQHRVSGSRSPSASPSTGSGRHIGSGAKIAPMSSHRSPINMAAGVSGHSLHSRTSTQHLDSIAARPVLVSKAVQMSSSTATAAASAASSKKTAGSSTVSGGGRNAAHRGLILLSRSSAEERADNRKNESVERKKRDDKQKLKAEKEAKKEEKRLAKEEERLAKLLAKEEKRKGKREAKELLVGESGRKK